MYYIRAHKKVRKGEGEPGNEDNFCILKTLPHIIIDCIIILLATNFIL